MNHFFIYFLSVFFCKLCQSQIKGVSTIPYHRFDYSNPLPLELNDKIDSLQEGNSVYYEMIHDTIRFKYRVDTLNGKFNGICKIWNLENKLLIKGEFVNNQKTGKWSYFYKNTPRKITRYFNDNYSFKEIIDKTERSFFKYSSIKKQPENYIKYPKVNEDSILYSQTVWRFIPQNFHNKHLFENKMWNKLRDYTFGNRTVKKYRTSLLNKEMTNEELISIYEMSDIDIIGFKIKEFFYFHKSYSNSESRIITICPVIKSRNKTKDLFWLFYPDIRKLLSSINVNLSYKIATAEDVFHYEYFNSYIYHVEDVIKREENVDLSNKSLTKKLVKNSIAKDLDRIYIERKKINPNNL